MHTAELILALIAYVSAGAAIALRLRHHSQTWYSHAWAFVGLVIHLAALAHISLSADIVTLGFGTALSLFAWVTALLLWLFSLRGTIGILGLIVYPVAGITALVSYYLPVGSPANDVLIWTVQLHIALSMLAYSLLTLGAVQAILFAVQHRTLRKSPPSALTSALPPLETMEGLLFRLINTGFWLLGLSIISGVVFINDLIAQHLAHKTAMSILAWIVFGILLWGRRRFGWRGRTAIRGAMIGYSVLVLAYFGNKLILELILGVHWY